jgi:hypothetical protein
MNIKNLSINNELKVTKSLYYIPDDLSYNGNLLTKEEIFNRLSCFIKEGDIWKVIGFKNDKVELLCIEGSMKDEFNDGWFDLEFIDETIFELI